MGCFWSRVIEPIFNNALVKPQIALYGCVSGVESTEAPVVFRSAEKLRQHFLRIKKYIFTRNQKTTKLQDRTIRTCSRN